MSVVYTWKIKNILAKKLFTDVNGTLRTNVIKSVVLEYEGVKDEVVNKIEKQVDFSLGDLSEFTPADSLDNDTVLSWALGKLNPKEKLILEKSVQIQFGFEEENTINLELNS